MGIGTSTVVIAGYVFEGPYVYETSLSDAAGVYVVLDSDGRVLYVGQSENIVTRLRDHEWRSCWVRNATGYIQYAAHYMPGSTKEQRMNRESFIRIMTDPPCGKI